MVSLCIFSLTWLWQIVVHRPSAFSHGEGGLPPCEEFTVGNGDNKEDTVTELELLGLGRAIVEVVLFGLSSKHVQTHSGSHLIDAILHFFSHAQWWSRRVRAVPPRPP